MRYFCLGGAVRFVLNFLYFIFYSFVGWVFETVVCSSRQRRFVKRGFLNGPYCPIYGCGAMLVIFLLEGVENPLLVFFFGMILCTALEYFTSFAMEKAFHARWWDYSGKRFNIGGRVCLENSVIFGALGLFLDKVLHPLVSSIAAKVPSIIVNIAGGAVAAGFVADYAVTVKGLSTLDDRLREFSEMMKEELKEAKANAKERLKRPEPPAAGRGGHDISASYKAFLKRMGFQQRRTLQSFPHFRPIRYTQAAEKIRALLEERRKDRPGRKDAGKR